MRLNILTDIFTNEAMQIWKAQALPLGRGNPLDFEVKEKPRLCARALHPRQADPACGLAGD
eukprot:700552-Amphidinium_carterae.1